MPLLFTNVSLFAALLLIARGGSRSVSRKAKIVIGTTLAVLCLPATLHTAYYLHLFDDWSWFYQVRSYQLSNLYPGALGALVGWLLPVIDRPFLRRLLIILTIPFVLSPFLKPLLAPLRESELQNQWRDGVCLQSTPSTCGPASVATVLNMAFADPAEERAVALASYSSATGTEVWYLAQFLRARGYRVAFHTRQPSPLPNSVAGTRLGSIGHFVAVLGCDQAGCQVADPMIGVVPHNQPRGFAFTGFFMQIYKAA